MKNDNPFPQPICDQIWKSKYKLTTANPEIRDDETVEDTWMRVANACAPDDDHRRNQYYEALEDFKFLPAGRITAGAGSGRNVTLFNCYVMGTIPDSIGGIFDMLKEAALTMQQGGGIGYDFSPLRPKDSPVKKVDADASGPLTFMDVWDAMCRTIMSAGERRGAMMATMDCTHPDVEAFITSKIDSNRFRMFNISVLVTDDFMEAVEKDDVWILSHKVAPFVPVEHNGNTMIGGEHIYKILQARDLWNLIMRSTYNHAEPGVLFIDRINKFNNLWYIEKISATNPCGEQPLPPYGACLLGSINLVKMLRDAFTEDARLDIDLLKKTTKTAVRMLDAVIDISIFPIPEQADEAKLKRRMGIGITGMADMLMMMNFVYGSTGAADMAEKVMKIIAIAAYEESIQMAKELGPCSVTRTHEQRQKFILSGFMMNMPQYITDDIMEHGIRNALLTSIAPTGTISLYAGNLSSGVEPIFAPKYTRKVLEKDGSKREELVEDYAVKLYREYRDENGWDKEDHKALVTAQDLRPIDHLVMQAAVQKWVDSSISKTINCPENITFEDFKEIYWEAWKRGCKGCTTYRPNATTGSILSVEPEKKDEGEAGFSYPLPSSSITEPMPRPDDLVGHTYKVRWQEVAVYVTINDLVDETGRTVPFEIFINSKQMEHYQWTVALTRMISAVFRRGGDITFIVEELKAVFDPKGGAFVPGRGYVPSFIALLGAVVNTHLENIGYIQQDETAKLTIELEEPEETSMVTPDQCPKCSGFNVVKEAGCPVCKDCGHSKCG